MSIAIQIFVCVLVIGSITGFGVFALASRLEDMS